MSNYDNNKCDCGKEATIGITGIDNGKIYSIICCNLCYNKSNGVTRESSEEGQKPRGRPRK